MKTERSRMRLLLQLCAASGGLSVAATRALTAQAVPPRDSTAGKQQVAVVIFAEATAGAVTFASQPQLHVTLKGGLDSLHVLDRRNLPSPVVTGRTYRDVHVAVEIFGRVNADCIARTLTGQPANDCASLELRGTRATPPTDSLAASSPASVRPPRN